MSPKPRPLAAAAAGLILAACGPGIPAGLDQDALEQVVCGREDVPQQFYLQNDGTFVPSNIADLTSDRDAALSEYGALGLEGGYFTLWSEALPRPPFEPPTTILCQAFQFAEARGAAGFVASLADDPDQLAAIALARLPREARAVEAEPPAGLPRLARAWTIEARDDQSHIEVYMVIFPAGRQVIAVYAGGEEISEFRGEAERLSRELASRATRSESP